MAVSYHHQNHRMSCEEKYCSGGEKRKTEAKQQMYESERSKSMQWESVPTTPNTYNFVYFSSNFHFKIHFIRNTNSPQFAKYVFVLRLAIPYRFCCACECECCFSPDDVCVRYARIAWNKTKFICQ